MLRRLVVLAATLMTAGSLAGIAGADAGAAQRLDIYGPNFEWACDFSFSVGPQTDTGSYAVLQYDKGANTVGATVQLKGMAPNTSFQVRLIQGTNDCDTIDGYITTNGQGNGTLNVSEPATSTQAAVFIWGANYTGNFYESAIFTHP